MARGDANDGERKRTGVHFADRSFAATGTSVLVQYYKWKAQPPSSCTRLTRYLAIITNSYTRVAFVHRYAITFMDILHFRGCFSPCGVPVGDTESTGVCGGGESLKKLCTFATSLAVGFCSLHGSLIRARERRLLN
jgi:hypothetical protein